MALAECNPIVVLRQKLSIKNSIVNIIDIAEIHEIGIVNKSSR